MRMCVFLLAVVALLCFEGQSRADKKGPPHSRKEVTGGGKYVFVMLAPQPVEEEIKSYGNEDAKNAVIAMRNVYKQSGLYKNDGSAEPLWTVDWYGPVTVLSDGEHLVRWGQPGLEQFRDKVDRKTREITENDMKQEAISIFAKGKLVREFKVADFADDRKALKMSVTMLLWRKEHKLDEAKKQLELVTNDGNRVRIDIATGKILEKKKAE
jgi:hypothetical protein